MFFNGTLEELHGLVNYIHKMDDTRIIFGKGFMDANMEIHIMDIMDNWLNSEFRMTSEVPMDVHDWIAYEYNPKKMSKDIFGTVDLWRVILDLNGMKHPGAFCKRDVIILPEPEQFKSFMEKMYNLKLEYQSSVDQLW
jgi:hypothetical protein